MIHKRALWNFIDKAENANFQRTKNHYLCELRYKKNFGCFSVSLMFMRYQYRLVDFVLLIHATQSTISLHLLHDTYSFREGESVLTKKQLHIVIIV